MVEAVVNPGAATAASAYRPRDVVNAPDIKQRIRERSAARGDSQEIAAWLANHFYRHVIGNLDADPPAVQPISTQAELLRLHRRTEPAAWALERLRAHAARQPPLQDSPAAGASAPLWWVEPDSAPLLALESRLLEFLSTRRGTALEGKLQRINCPQALARWTLEHLAFARKSESGWAEHRPGAVRPLLRGQLGVFVEFDAQSPDLRAEMAYESQMMRHCLGQFSARGALRGGYGEHYAEACEQGRLRLFSYRTGTAQPRITVSAQVLDGGRLRIDQIKGKQNRPPIARYLADVLALLNHLDADGEAPADALAMGIVRRPAHLLASGHTGAWCAASELHTEAEQLWLLQAHPALLEQLDIRSPLMQWLVAARRDTVPVPAFERMPRSAALQQSLELARRRAGSPGRTGNPR
ncbi:collagen alpha-1(I) chain [Delftia tsuruhatensis]|nr:collagen alpha-1(I) chain [Delftia tsuruhatensis]